jgi:hypothetical protein
MFWEELMATSKLLSSTHFKIKGNCSLGKPLNLSTYSILGRTLYMMMYIHVSNASFILILKIFLVG